MRTPQRQGASLRFIPLLKKNQGGYELVHSLLIKNYTTVGVHVLSAPAFAYHRWVICAVIDRLQALSRSNAVWMELWPIGWTAWHLRVIKGRIVYITRRTGHVRFYRVQYLHELKYYLGMTGSL